MTTISKGELFYSTYYSACIRTLHKMKARLMFMPVSVVTLILLPTLVQWTLHDTEPCPSDVYGLRVPRRGVSLYHLKLFLLKQGKMKILLQKGFI